MSSGSESRGLGRTPPPIDVIQLKPGMENVTVRVRVLNTTQPRTIETKKGTRTISNAIVGDSTGRVEAVLWGEKAATLKAGDVVEIKGAWVTEYRGKVQLNIGKGTSITHLPGDSVPEEVPESSPKATGRPFTPGRGSRRGFTTRRKRGEESE